MQYASYMRVMGCVHLTSQEIFMQSYNQTPQNTVGT